MELLTVTSIHSGLGTRPRVRPHWQFPSRPSRLVRGPGCWLLIARPPFFCGEFKVEGASLCFTQVSNLHTVPAAMSPIDPRGLFKLSADGRDAHFETALLPQEQLHIFQQCVVVAFQPRLELLRYAYR